jgi:hypothetical protein
MARWERENGYRSGIQTVVNRGSRDLGIQITEFRDLMAISHSPGMAFNARLAASFRNETRRVAIIVTLRSNAG